MSPSNTSRRIAALETATTQLAAPRYFILPTGLSSAEFIERVERPGGLAEFGLTEMPLVLVPEKDPDS